MTLPRPEYPRPTLCRKEWLNLNGTWDFAFDDAKSGIEERWYEKDDFPQRITVPYSYQTELSGINDKGVHEVVWYSRTIKIPKNWGAGRLLIHFGAVDYRSTLWVNGIEVGHNQGGHVPFSFDIAPYLSGTENRITLRVEDSQDPHQPRGKQAVSGVPREIDYYCTTGIWQTVWLEPLPRIHIESLRITPLIKEGAFEVLALLHAPSTGWRMKAKVLDGETVVCETDQRTTNATSRIMLRIPDAKRWSPESPHLYDIELSLMKDDAVLDTVTTYAGMRSVQLIDGALHLNEEPYYLCMALDQGYWPSGGLTAPTDEALRKDVELAKEFGFNGVRKHQKIEDPRWLYWCDKLGLAVWGEMANARAWNPQSEEWLIAEWERAVRRDYNHPCVITWVPMNESWGVPGLRQNHPGQFAFLERIVHLTRRNDQFRPVIDNDGWEHTDIGDICAIHDYTQNADGIRQRYASMLKGEKLPETMWLGDIRLFAQGAEYHGQPVILTEVGGFLLLPPNVPSGELDVLYQYYGVVNDESEILAKYENLMLGIAELKFVVGFCYTQLTDVEQEINGLTTYDRQPKVTPAEIRAINEKVRELRRKG